MRCLITIERKGNGLGKVLSKEIIDDGKEANFDDLVPAFAEGFLKWAHENELDQKAQ